MDYYGLLLLMEAEKGEQEAGQAASAWNGFLFFCNGGFLCRDSAGRQLPSGIPSVAVKCVDIRRNTSGEGGLLDDN